MAKRGDIFDVDSGPQQDSRMEGMHPALVVQTDLLNAVDGYNLIIIVPLSTKGRNSPSHIRIEPNAANGLSSVSYAKCEQIYTIPNSLLLKQRGYLAKDDQVKVSEALRIVLALE